MSLANPYTVALVIVAAMSGALVAFGWQRRETPGAVPFAAFVGGITVWALGYGLALGTPPGGGHRLLSKLLGIGVVVVPTAWFLFALEYTGREGLVSRPLVAILAVEPLVTLGLHWTTETHGLYWRSAEVVRAGPVWLTAVDRGVWFWTNLAYSYLLVLVGTWLLVEIALSTRRVYRGRAVALSVGVAVPLVANALYVADVGIGPVEGLNPTPFAFAASAVAFAWALDDRGLFEALPVVPSVDHEAIVNEIADGVVVLDAADRIVDCNPAARELAERDVEGATLAEAFPPLAEAVPDIDPHRDEREEVNLDDGGRERYFEVQASGIARDGERLGTVVTLHDITERVIREQRLDVLNRVLRHNVRQETNLILGHSDILETTLSEEMTEHASVMAGAARNLAEWSDQARYVERVLERASQERHPVDMDAAVTDGVRSVERGHSDAEITVESDGDAWATAHEALSDAVQEVIENAAAHNDRDRPTVDVTVESDDQWVRISVADDGPGIPPEERAVFERGRETPLEHGSGMGLWLVNWIVRISGGSVDLDDNDPRGTVVRIRVPAAGVTHGPPEESTAFPPSTTDASDVDGN